MKRQRSAATVLRHVREMRERLGVDDPGSLTLGEFEEMLEKLVVSEVLGRAERRSDGG